MKTEQSERMEALERRVNILEGRSPDAPAPDSWNTLLEGLEERIAKLECERRVARQ